MNEYLLLNDLLVFVVSIDTVGYFSPCWWFYHTITSLTLSNSLLSSLWVPITEKYRSHIMSFFVASKEILYMKIKPVPYTILDGI